MPILAITGKWKGASISLSLIGIAAMIALLVIQVGLAGAAIGVALIGLTSLLTMHSATTGASEQSSFPTSCQKAISILDAVPGMTLAHPKDFEESKPSVHLSDGTIVRIWKNPAGVYHIFLSSRDNRQILYRGFVGWIHTQGLKQAIKRIEKELA